MIQSPIRRNIRVAGNNVGIIELFIIAVGLSADAFAVAVCKGLAMPRIRWGQALVIAFAFGAFQAGMPVIGWLVGDQFARFITPIDHWIAFVLLAAIGAKMIWDAFHEEPAESTKIQSALDLKELLALAVATSIDALAVGISFAFLGVNIAVAAAIIGVTTFCLSFVGVIIGHRFGARFEKAAAITGGVVLILIGLKILLEHLGILAF